MTSPIRAPRPRPRPVAAPVDRRAHLRVVPPEDSRPRARRRAPAVLAASFVLVFGSLLASAVFHGLLVSGQAHLDQVDADISSTQAELAREKLELADLQSPARIAAEAERLGMEPATEQIWLSPGSGDAPVVTGSPADEPTLDGSESSDGTDGTVATDGADGSGSVDERAAGSTGAAAQ